MASKRRSVVNSIPSINCYMDYDYELYTKDEALDFCQRYRCYLITFTVTLLILVVGFILVFVVPPITFMLSIQLQRYFIFLTSYGNEVRDFTNFGRHGLQGVRNMYLPVRPNVTLGAWHILPSEYVCKAVANESYDYANALKDGTYPVLLYFHDSGENRITSKNKYIILRQFFHVITFDYRSFGDSSRGELLEDELMYDSVYLYKWLISQNDKVYVWGHGLGSAIATKMISCKEAEAKSSGKRETCVRKIPPKGVFLESAFTNLVEVFTLNSYLKMFSWIPWFDATLLDPLRKNFMFSTDIYIRSVDCPIMIMHAEDNGLVHYSLAEKLLQKSQDGRRGSRARLDVLLRLFLKQYQYGHNDIYLSPEFPGYIRDHISRCDDYNNNSNVEVTNVTDIHMS